MSMLPGSPGRIVTIEDRIMSKRQITATITDARDSPAMAYLRIEASNGRTYARVTDKYRKRPDVVTYCTWPTATREIDVPCDLRNMPKAVRLLSRASLAKPDIVRLADELDSAMAATAGCDKTELARLIALDAAETRARMALRAAINAGRDSDGTGL
jgi:hypothetical protein